MLGKLALDAFGLSFRLVNLVDGHDDRHICGFGVVDRFLHVCGITPSSAATTSTTMSVTFAPRARIRVKCLVTRCIYENNFAAVDVYDGSADVLA